MTVFLNKFLKHVFNIALKLNNHTWKKSKTNFLRKKMRPNQWFCSREKSSKSLKKMFFWKKILPTYLCRYDLQNAVQKIFFLNKWFWRYLNFGYSKIPKNDSSLKNYKWNSIDKKSRIHTPFCRQLSHKSSRKISTR